MGAGCGTPSHCISSSRTSIPEGTRDCWGGETALEGPEAGGSGGTTIWGGGSYSALPGERGSDGSGILLGDTGSGAVVRGIGIWWTNG